LNDFSKLSFPDFNFCACDLSSFEQTAQLADWLCKTDNLPDILILNAGVFIAENYQEHTADWSQMMHVNFLHQQYLFNRILPLWVAKKSGHLICIGSTAGNIVRNDAVGYSLSKMLLHNWAGQQFKMLREKGIQVTTLIPGSTYTDSWHGSGIPPEKLINPDDIAAMVVEMSTFQRSAMLKSIEIRSSHPEIDM
jgi:short-subunit dehydrogenase